MTQVIHSRRVISITEFRKNPVECVNFGKGALAIMSRNHPAFYCVPAEEYGKLLELAEIGKKHQSN